MFINAEGVNARKKCTQPYYIQKSRTAVNFLGFDLIRMSQGPVNLVI